MMYWTEEAIARDLEGKFYRMQTFGDGSMRVVDVNAMPGAMAQPYAAPRWTQADLVLLVIMKRKGMSNLQISVELNRDMNGISQKWAERSKWKDGLFIPRQEILTLNDIARTVCNVVGVASVDFFSMRRMKKVTEARQIFYWVSRYFTSLSYPQIGAFSGGKDHSTVIHGVHKIDEQFDAFRSRIELCLFDLGLSEKTREAA